MRFFDPEEKAFSLIEVMIALTIVLAGVALAGNTFRNCGRTHKKIVAGEAAEVDVSLLVANIEKDFNHSTASALSGQKGRFRTNLRLTQSDGVTHNYQSQCRAGTPVSLPMNHWKGECFRAMACPSGSTAVVNTSAGVEYPAGLPQDGRFAYALCAEDLGSGSIRVVIEAAVFISDAGGGEPRIITKEKILSRNASLGGEIQLLPKP